MKTSLAIGMIIFFFLSALSEFQIIKINPATITYNIVGLLCLILAGICYGLIKLEQIIEMMKKNKADEKNKTDS